MNDLHPHWESTDGSRYDPSVPIPEKPEKRSVPIAATGLVCLVPPTMSLTALEAVNATLIDNTSNVLSGVAKVIMLPWLTAANIWYLLKTDGVIRPFIFQDREPVEFNALAENSEESFKREKFLYGVRARYRMTYGYWQFAVRTVFVLPS